ncbi:MAG: DUF1499 domain-containing protein [Alphaproteobacteria bacterium]|nr:DUF1499 domain-containing protein [Alphaproteobacteria bacterium]
MIDFKTLKLQSRLIGPSPNQFLLTPLGYGIATPHHPSPEYAAAPKALFEAFRASALSAERVKIMTEDPASFRAHFLQRSRVFRFPDDLWFQALALDEKRSTILIYSRSRYGYRDFGVNQMRAGLWVRGMHDRLGHGPIGVGEDDQG